MSANLPANDPYFDLTTGIIAAKTDAHHDFKSLYEETFVNAELPPHEGLPYVSEDTFLTTYTVENVNDIKIPQTAPTNKVLESITSNILKEPLKSSYTVVAYRNKKLSEEEDEETSETSETSVLQDLMNELGIEEDIFIICDVAFSWIRYDLGKVNKQKEQIFWWTQTTQTGFDPAKKTGWHSGKELGFREPWSQGGARFCWQSITKTDKPNKLYLPWPIGKNVIGSEDENAMLCLNKKLLMVAKSENNKNWDPKTHTSFLLVYDVSTKKYVYATKDMAAKNFEMSKGMISSYKDLGAKLISMFKEILVGGNKLPNLETYTLQYQMLAKRCGDMPQALECLNRSLRLQTLVNPTKKPSLENVGIPTDFGNNRSILYEGENGVGGIFEGNGNNMFVSYDRIAVAQALNYRAPLVLYDQPFGIVLFVNNSLLDDRKKLLNALKTIDSASTVGKVTYDPENPLYFTYGSSKTLDFVVEKAPEFSSNLKLLLSGIELVTSVRDALSNTLYGLQVTNDEELRSFLSAYFANLTKLEIVNNMFQRMNKLSVFIEQSNQEFKNIASLPDPTLLIEDNQLNVGLLQTAANLLFNEYSGIFEQAINLEGEVVVKTDNSNTSEFLSKLAGLVGFVVNLITTIGTLKDEYETLSQLASVEPTVPKGIDGNISSITPSVVVDLRLTRHDPEQKVFGMAEKVFQHEKVITPIWSIVGKLDQDVFPLADDFIIKMLGYVSAVLANPTVSNAKMYSLVVKKAIADLNKLFGSSVSQLGGALDSDNVESEDGSDFEQMFDVDTTDETGVEQPGLIAESSGPIKSNVFDLLGWAKEGNFFFAEDQVFNAINFDLLLKNTFNVLSFHYLRLKLDGKDSVLSAFDLYQKIGNYLGIMEFESKDPFVPAMPSSSINDNMFLFNAMESQVYASDITYEYDGRPYNFAKILYFYFNQQNNQGLVLFPEINDVVLDFGNTMNRVFDELMSIDLTRFLGFVERIAGQTSTLQVEPKLDGPRKPMASPSGFRETLKRSRSFPGSQRRATIKRQRVSEANENEEVVRGGKAKRKTKKKTLKSKRRKRQSRIRHGGKGKLNSTKNKKKSKNVKNRAVKRSGKRNKRTVHQTLRKKLK